MVIDWDGKLILKNILSNEFKPWYSGNYNDDLSFEYGAGTTAAYGCGATLMGQFWYFGGTQDDANKRQVNE